MKLRLGGVALLAALGAVGALAATGFGDPGSGDGSAAGPLVVSAHRVAEPSSGAAKSGASSSTTTLIYKESGAKGVGTGDHTVIAGRCPRHSHVIDGYYRPDGFGVLSEGTALKAHERRWKFFVRNSSAGSRLVRFGIICLRL